ncbi:hypothetical protein [Photobacterium aquimaris]|uniref:Uncharacterized protein n=1 Tax=Photobacterium aquimaris TaxID=512643 RepID=A0A2T3I0P8_9GAMM|nr:hypothetical protein [Photobacterium aquimaris]OBU25646.1 hypothetical protein AYY21_08675 [Photobacterium aquimaris]PQJ37056.1 hypothetical protein BTN98_18115 [Photobacterium aquimaris]PSU10088.1 hypothetical protein C0W81_05020 [Photobacterium aquimaris]
MKFKKIILLSALLFPCFVMSKDGFSINKTIDEMTDIKTISGTNATFILDKITPFTTMTLFCSDKDKEQRININLSTKSILVDTPIRIADSTSTLITLMRVDKGKVYQFKTKINDYYEGGSVAIIRNVIDMDFIKDFKAGTNLIIQIYNKNDMNKVIFESRLNLTGSTELINTLLTECGAYSFK